VSAAANDTQSLTFDAGAGTVEVVGAAGTSTTALADLTVTAASTATLNSVFTTGAQAVTADAIALTGTTYATDAATASTITMTGPVTLGDDTAMTASTVTFTTTLDSSGVSDVSDLHTLEITGDAVFVGAVGATDKLGSLTVSGMSAIDGGSVRTSGLQTYSDDVTLGANTTLTSLSSGDVEFGAKLDGAYTLAVNTAGVTTFGGAVGSVGAGLVSLTTDADGSTEVNGGSIKTSDATLFNDAVTLGDHTRLTATTVTFGKTVDSSVSGSISDFHTLSVVGDAVFGDEIGEQYALGSLTVSGTTALNGGSVRTSGLQKYSDDVTLGDNTTLTSLSSGAIEFGAKLDGAFTLTVNTAGVTTFDGAVGSVGAGLVSLTTDAAGSTVVNGGSVKTTSATTFNDAVTLGDDATLTATTVTFGKTLDSSGSGTTSDFHTLSITGNAVFGGEVGGQYELGSLSVSGTSSIAAGIKTGQSGGVNGAAGTTGDQTFDQAVTLTGNVSLVTDGGTIWAKSTIDSEDDGQGETLANDLTIDAGNGMVTLDAAVGDTDRIGDLVLLGAATRSVAGEITSNTFDVAGGNLQANNLAGELTITAQQVATVSGNTELGGAITVVTDEFDIKAGLDPLATGTHRLAIETFTAGKAITLGAAGTNLDPSTGAAGSLDLVALELARIGAGFADVTIGNATGTRSAVTFAAGAGNTATLASELAINASDLILASGTLAVGDATTPLKMSADVERDLRAIDDGSAAAALSVSGDLAIDYRATGFSDSADHLTFERAISGENITFTQVDDGSLTIGQKVAGASMSEADFENLVADDTLTIDGLAATDAPSVMTIAGDVATDSNLSLAFYDIAFDADLTVNNGNTLTLESSNGVSQDETVSVIDAAALLVSGAGVVELDGQNSISTLASDATDAVTVVVAGGDVTIGTVNNVSGMTGATSIDVEGARTIAIDQAVAADSDITLAAGNGLMAGPTSDGITIGTNATVTSTNGDVVLDAGTTGNFVNARGTDAVSAGGNWQIWSAGWTTAAGTATSTTHSQFGPDASSVLVSGEDAVWNTDWAAGRSLDAAITGNRYVFASAAPALAAASLKVNTGGGSKQYGESVSDSDIYASSTTTLDTQITVSAPVLADALGTAVVGSAFTVTAPTATAQTITDLFTALDTSSAGQAQLADVGQYTVELDGATSVDSIALTVDGNGHLVSGGNRYRVVIDGVAYQFTASNVGQIDVTPKLIDAEVADPTRVYNGSDDMFADAAALNVAVTVDPDQMVNGQTLVVTASTGEFDNKNAGDRGWTVSGLALADASTGAVDGKASNYQLNTSTLTGTADINKRQLTADVTGTPTKVYDATDVATLTDGNYQINNLVAGESLVVTQTQGSYDAKNAGDATARTVTVTLTATDFTEGNNTLASNYILPTTASGAGAITPKSITITGLGGQGV